MSIEVTHDDSAVRIPDHDQHPRTDMSESAYPYPRRSARICTIVLLLTYSTTFADEQLDAVVRSAAARVAPSVVRIRTIARGDTSQAVVSSQTSTGLAVPGDGLIVTSSFSVRGQAAAIFVEDAQGNRHSAEIVARDQIRNLILLKCEGADFQTPAFIEEQWPEPGAYAIAMGRLFPGNEPSISVGIISAVGRVHGLAIQADAKISPVNYGGPLVTVDGRVSGLLVPLSPTDRGDSIAAGVEWYDSGIGFAIPARDLLIAVEKLTDGTDMLRGVLGASFATRNPLEPEIRIAAVIPDSPADKVGLKAGDQILRVNGQQISRFGIFESIIRSSSAGTTLNITAIRNKEETDYSVTLTDKLNLPAPGQLGLLPDEGSIADSGREDTVVVNVLPDSPAFKAGLTDQCVILKINEAPVTGRSEFRQRARTFAGTSVSVEWKPKPDSPDTTTTEIQAVARPDAVLSFKEDFVRQVTGSDPDAKWGQEEQQIAEQGTLRIFRPEEKQSSRLGVLVMLSENDRPFEVVYRNWERTCQAHNLMLVCPENLQRTDLTAEDMTLIQECLTAVSQRQPIDMDRIIFVSSPRQSELCFSLLTNSRQQSVNRAVFLDTWPVFHGTLPETLISKRLSLLTVSSGTESRQQRALRSAATSALRAGGVRVIEITRDEDLQKHIAAWALQEKVR